MRKAYKKLTYADRQEIEQSQMQPVFVFRPYIESYKEEKTKTVNIKRKLRSSHYLHRTGKLPTRL